MKNIFLVFAFIVLGEKALAQTGNLGGGIEVIGAEFENTVNKKADKRGDLPVIHDTVPKITKIDYNINSKPMYPPVSLPPIAAAKMVNEPLSKLYHSLLKLGFGNYSMPLGEFYYNNLRSREINYGLRLKHLSSIQQDENKRWSDNEARIYGQKYFKKHTLSGEFNYLRNVNHFYGSADTVLEVNPATTKQRYQIFEPKLRLLSHYTDTTSINHDLNLNYYHLDDNRNNAEDNIFGSADLNTYYQGEKMGGIISADYYANSRAHDTVGDFIFRLAPYVAAEGKKWKADLSLCLTVDKWKDEAAKFYFYPKLNVYYDIYNSVVIPYAGVTGGMERLSLRKMYNDNPFINPEFTFIGVKQQYANVSNRFTLFGGLRGALSAKTSYDAKVSYGDYTNMPFYYLEYDYFLNNKFNVVYENIQLLNVSGQLKYQFKEKLNLLAKGNYYKYNMALERHPWHKPNFDLTFSGIYNLKSKLIAKMDLFILGNQWVKHPELVNNVITYNEINIKPIADVNLGFEYRYSKMLSFFLNFTNMAAYKYQRWDSYPTQRFGVMGGLTFIPF